jgi:hypothetical protein
MKHRVWCSIIGALVVAAMPAAAGEPAGTSGNSRASASMGSQLTLQQILERHIAARGGADAWQKVQSMAWTGRIESGAGGISKTPFMMIYQRPEATRFEVIAQGQHLVRAFNGTAGWKMLPTVNGVPDIKPFDADDIAFAHDAGGLDGPLMGSRSKGVKIALDGIDAIDGRQAYRLKVTLPSGQVQTHWLDATSFLDLRFDRANRNSLGLAGKVSVYLLNYQTLQGLTMPMQIETHGSDNTPADKMIIEKVAINPPVEASTFVRPSIEHLHNGIVVDTTDPSRRH